MPESEFRRGELYQCNNGPGRRPQLVVLVSRDDLNQNPPDGEVWVMPIVRKPSPLAVRLGEADPARGWVRIHKAAWIERDRLYQPGSMLTGATMEAIREALDRLQADDVPELGD